MRRFYGFDLGDAESAISLLEKNSEIPPTILEIEGVKSFITAYAALSDGTLLIGENACYARNAQKRKLRFKSRFLKEPSVEQDVKSFAAGVLGALYASGDLLRNDEDSCFYIGCPAGWDLNERERYRGIFERAGYPPVKVISESRAALISACQSKHLQIGYDILSRPMLVVDIGSSTTDFAYIDRGKEVEMQTGGEVYLGGGVMDDLLLNYAVDHSGNPQKIRRIFEESEAWKNYCEFACRRLKEKYYSDTEYFKDHPCKDSVLIRQSFPATRLVIEMSAEIAHHLEEGASPKLEGSSFKEVFLNSLRNVRQTISGQTPELLFLTGGVSKMPGIRQWCAEVFPEAVIITGAEPEFSVSRGLAWSGSIDEELREFRADLEELKRSTAVEDIVKEHIKDLYKDIVETLTRPIIRNAAVPVFERWRNGEINKLTDTNEELEKEIAKYLRSEEARELMIEPIANWLKPIAEKLEEYTVPICIKHHVPYTALSLKSFMRLTDLDVKISAKDVFAVSEITWLIDSIISIVVGLLCGGSGVALIASGPTGIFAGMMISILVLALGKDKMEELLLKTDLPRPLRKLVPKNTIESRMDAITGEVRANLYKSLENEKNDEITEHLVNDISAQIEECLTKMAEVVEIPLG
ncbi:MAG: Hsp70 family protein [Erysipelotrichaceae bacterium]|nr:Hsp70 family protein [Erysipelotrichaceae bacterium]